MNINTTTTFHITTTCWILLRRFETPKKGQNRAFLQVSNALKRRSNAKCRCNVNPEKEKAGSPRKWLAYSPETLINRYGSPSKVNFNVDRGEAPSYGMVMYFDSKKLIVEYYSYDLGARWQVCPLLNQMDSVWLWMGRDPQYPPLEDVPLEKATSMTIEEFSKLMTGIPSKACFILKEEVFP